MARFVTVNVQCDWDGCDVVAPEGDGTVVSKTLSIDGKQAREFLLCVPKHLEAFDDTVLPLMAAGVKVADTPKRSTPSAGTAVPGPVGDPGKPTIDCKHTGCNRTGEHGLKNNAGLAQHVIKAHGYADLAEYELAYPSTHSPT